MLLGMLVVSALEAQLETKMLACLAQAGSFAEGILSSIRTIHSLGLRTRLVDRYDVHLLEALRYGRKKDPVCVVLVFALCATR